MKEDPVRDQMMVELGEIISQMERLSDGQGVEFGFFDDDTVVEIHTENSIYKLYVLDCKKCVVLATGNNKYLLKTTKCQVNGCTWGGTAIKLDHVVVGMHLELRILEAETERPIITTSPIRRIVFRL